MMVTVLLVVLVTVLSLAVGFGSGFFWAGWRYNKIIHKMNEEWWTHCQRLVMQAQHGHVVMMGGPGKDEPEIAYEAPPDSVSTKN